MFSGCKTKTSMLGRGISHWRSKTVLAFGDSTSGILGLGAEIVGNNRVYEPQAVSNLPSNVEHLACGSYHSLAVTSCGQLWAWGRNVEGQLGRPPESGEEFDGQHRVGRSGLVEGFPLLEGDRRRILGAAASGVVSFAIDSEGGLWSWGASSRGQLGLGRGVTASHLPQRVAGGLEGKCVATVAAGWGHTLALTSTGALYSWGYSANGRLGSDVRDTKADDIVLPEKSSKEIKEMILEIDQTVNASLLNEAQVLERSIQWDPQPVLEHLTFVHVTCGMDHSVAITDVGDVYTFGYGGNEVLGWHEESVGASCIGVVSGHWWECGDNEDLPIEASAGVAHTVIRTKGGRVFTFGSNSDGQLGRTGGSNIREVDLDGESIVGVAAGRYHTMALSHTGEVWGWGAGKGGRLGTGCGEEEKMPAFSSALEGIKVEQVQCGNDFTLVLSD